MPEHSPQGPGSPRLSEVQSLLSRIFSNPEGSFDGSAQERSALKAMLVHTDDDDLQARVGIYADAYFLRLKDILESDFSASRKYLSPELFLELTVDYLKARPSRGPNAAAVGRELPDFVAGHTRWQKISHLPAIVRLEWEIIECIYSPFAKNAFEKFDLAQVNLAALSFVGDPSIRWIEESRLIENFWLQPDSLTLADVPEEPQRPHLLVRRLEGGKIGFFRMSELEKNFYWELRQDRPLVRLLEAFADAEGIESLVAGLGEWFSLGLIKNVSNPRSDGQV